MMETTNPKEHKRLGRLVKDFDFNIWNKSCQMIVNRGNWYKANQNNSFYELLVSTGDKILVEGSPYDKIWGVGLAYDNPDILNKQNWKGENRLGIALMNVREALHLDGENPHYHFDPFLWKTVINNWG